MNEASLCWYLRYREVSKRVLRAAEDGDYTCMRENLAHRSELIKELDDGAPPPGEGHRALDILREISEMDKGIERHLVIARDKVAESLQTVRAYAGGRDLSVEARAYDRMG